MDQISNYIDSLTAEHKSMCELLKGIIDRKLNGSISKLFHGSPVWFINDNPILGISIKQKKVQLLFWSGQSFKKSGLTPAGNFKAAEKLYENVSGIDEKKIESWIEESKETIWDYKNIRRNGGQLNQLSRN